MARLPQPGADDGVWGAVLNDYLLQSLAADGSLKNSIVTQTKLDSGVQSLIAGKADVSSLSQVATTGAYADLSGTPTVPIITASVTPPTNPTIGDMWVDLSS